jgi:hypothetical protein
MTAINVLKLPNSVHVLTDGMASTSLFGGQWQLGFAPKCFPLPHLNAAIATRGGGGLLQVVTTMLTIEPRDFAGLVRALRRIQSIVGEASGLWQRGQVAGDFDIVVAGVGLEGPAAYLVSNHGAHGFAPWEVFEIPQVLATPAVSQDLFEQVFGADDALAEMPCLVDAQLAHPSVGGFAQLTSIDMAGITTRLVRDYRSSN